MRKNKKQEKTIFLLILILGITIGFALLSTTLKINGIASIKSNTWNIHWDDESVVVTPNSVSGSTPIVTGTNDNTVEFSTTLELPGDFYEFTIDAVNEGSIDGAISLIVDKTYKVVNNVDQETTLPSYILYTVKYSDNTTPQEGDVLKSNQSKTYKIRVEYDPNSEVLPAEDTTYKFKFTTDYEQYKEETVEPRTCAQFQSDSWSTIAHNVTLKPDTYPIECEKEITMDVDEDGTNETYQLVIVNNTTPEECNSTNFSQSACGFVIQFKDFLKITSAADKKMNPSATNEGGWPASKMHTYLNTTVYGKLPNDLKNVIIYTKTVSGHDNRVSSNYVSNSDKLYLLAAREVGFLVEFDSASSETRLLDYYYGKGNAARIKYIYNTTTPEHWWLRTAASNRHDDFVFVYSNGSRNGGYANSELGVSPAFRIGKD